MGGVLTVLVERNTTVPTHKSKVFSTAEDNQPAVDVFVFQGERPMARDNKSLGNFKLDGIQPAQRSMPMIEVSFDIDANGIVNVGAKVQATGKEQKITTSASTNLTKEDIDRLLQEATANAASDRKTKEDVDTRNEADQTCYHIEHQLTQGGEQIRETNRSRAQLLIADLRQRIERNESAEEIKKATADLRGMVAMLQQDLASPASSVPPTGSAEPQEQSSHESSPGAHGQYTDEDIIDAEVTAA